MNSTSDACYTLPDRVVFLADAHLGMPGDDPARADRFAKFLLEFRGRISHLYIAGDLFDFWFEYRSVVPRTAPAVLAALYLLVREGIHVTFLAGNHDYWTGSYLRDGIGLDIVPDGCHVEHQGRRIYLHHGDGLYPEDRGYRLMKRVLRSRVSIALFGMLHPTMGAWLARVTSSTSRRYLAPNDFVERNTAHLREVADARLGDDCDAVVYGHAHVPLIEHRDKGDLVLLGDCIANPTAVILENARFRWYDRSADNTKPSPDHS